MKYCCEKCETEFSKKSTYVKHMNRKTPCIEEEKEQFDINKRTCPHCEEIYSSPKAVKVHMNICKKKPPEEYLIEMQKNKLEEIITQLSKKLDNQNNEINDMKNKLLNNDVKINDQNNELKDLKSKLSNNNSKIDKQNDKLEGIKSKLTDNNSKINKQTNKLNNLKSKLSNNDIPTQVTVIKIDNQNEKTPNKKIVNKEIKPKKKAIPKTLKNKVWNKYIGIEIGQTKCLCCKLTDISQLNFHCGHIISEKDGGKITMENLKPICGSCNSSMGTMNMDEFILKYEF
jgi:chromosome segregation ATPase